MKAETEAWQVSTPEGVFQADLQTLKRWVAEGLVMPEDRVRKGSLNWIEAGRAPSLRRVFTGEERVEVSAQPTLTDAHAADLGLADDDAQEVSEAAPPAAPVDGGEGAWEAPADAPTLGSSCHFHPSQAATLVCRGCAATFCRACPNRVGTSSVLLCALCGGFCDPLEILTGRLALLGRANEPYGLGDFRAALAYPFRHKASLLGGALIYGFLLVAGMRGQLLASALVFGCLSLVVRRVAYGEMGRDFMPDFSEFNFWDDCIVPGVLGVGVTLVTLGPLLLLAGALILGWLGGGGAPQAPAPLALAPRDEAGRQKAEGVTADDMSALVGGGGTAEEEQELERKVNAMRPGAEVPRRLGQTKPRDDGALAPARTLFARPGLILVPAALALLWAVFYHPMALLVAGWTESLKSVLNPLVGLDTMRHMGATYFKAFLMYLAVQAAALALSLLVGVVTAPFDMPLVGNLPATFLGGVVTFYTSLVIACLLGLALFKSSDRLGIELD